MNVEELNKKLNETQPLACVNHQHLAWVCPEIINERLLMIKCMPEDEL